MATQEIHCSHDLPISQCREHWVEFCAATDNTIEQRVLKWAFSGDTGISSETMAAYFTGVKKGGPFGSQAPSDAADRGRCIRLLNIIPEWVERLDELKALDVGTISINGADPIPRAQDTHSWTHQIQLIIKEGGF